jgi:exopolysaccharide production protein ExoQ
MDVRPSIRHRQHVQRWSRQARAAGRPEAIFTSRTGDRGISLLLAMLVGTLIIYLTIPGYLFSHADPNAIDMAANPVSRVIKLLMLGISGVVVVRRKSLSWLLLRYVNAFFLVFLVLVPLSYLWSISPGDTLARFISILSVVCVCMAFCVAGWHPRRFQNVLRPVITSLLVGSILFGLFAPDLAIMQGVGSLKDAWRGLTTQKNPFGQLATFGLIFWLHAGLSRQVKYWRAVLGSVVAFSCVLLSRSSTSLMATVIVSLFLLMALRSPAGLRRYMPFLVTLLAIAVLTYALAVLNLLPGASILLDPITAITGKDATFTNRSEIWRIIRDHIRLSPVLGTGYGAYWIGPVPSSPSYTFLGQMYLFYTTESHNGYLEIVNDLGYVGLICLLGFLTVYVQQSLQLIKVDRPQGVLFLGLFFQQAIVNLSESCWLAVNSGFIFVIMTLAVVALARALLDHNLREYVDRIAAGREQSQNTAQLMAPRQPP